MARTYFSIKPDKSRTERPDGILRGNKVPLSPSGAGKKNRLHTWNSDYSRIDLTNESFQSYKCLFSPYGDNFPHLISITEGLKLHTVYDRFHSFLWSSVFRTEIRLKWMSLLRKGPFDTHKSARKRDYRKIWVQHEYLWYSLGYHISWNAIKKGIGISLVIFLILFCGHFVLCSETRRLRVERERKWLFLKLLASPD